MTKTKSLSKRRMGELTPIPDNRSCIYGISQQHGEARIGPKGKVNPRSIKS